MKKKTPTTFGERIAPILSDIEDAIVDRQVNLPGEKPNYSTDSFRAALLTFLVALYMCNMLAKAAQTVWMVVYRNARREPVANRDIDTLLYTSKRLAELELGSTEIDARDEAKVRNLRAATDILGRKIVQFVREQPTNKIKDNV